MLGAPTEEMLDLNGDGTDDDDGRRDYSTLARLLRRTPRTECGKARVDH
mgnify:CR=1 FL=1